MKRPVSRLSPSARFRTATAAGSITARRAPWHGAALALLASLACTASAWGAPTGTITEFPIPSAASVPQGIAPGPDGNVWFTEFEADKIALITPVGTVAEFPLPNPEGGPTAITTGPDGNLWFTEHGAGKMEGRGAVIGRITTSGAISEFATRTKEAAPNAITLGPDGNLWFTESRTNRIGRITPSGEVAEFPTEHSTGGVAGGPDGNIWFTEPGGNKIGVISPTGTIREYPVPAEGEPTENSQPEAITAGPDGNLWFTEGSHNRIGRITPAGTITQFPIPTEHSGPVGIAAGPDGDVWFTEFGGGGRRTIGRITPTGAITEFLTPTAESGPVEIAPAADGGMWFTEHAKNQIGEISTGAAEAAAGPPSIAGGGLAGTPQVCNMPWSTWGSLQPSSALFGFDGYRWLLNGSLIATGPSYTPSLAQVGGSLLCDETVTYPEPFLVTTGAASQAVAVVAPPPTITAAHESSSTWRLGSKLAQVAGRRKPSPIGATFSYVLNEPAAVSWSFTQRVLGSTVGRTCVARTRSNARHRACMRTVNVARLSFAGQAGLNQVVFQGRVSRRSTLRPGRYALVIVATNVAGVASPPATLSFAIQKG